MSFCDFARNVEAEPETLFARVFFSTREWLKQPLHDCLWDPRAAVAYYKLEHIAFRLGRKRDGLTARAMRDGIPQKIGNHLLQPSVVHINRPMHIKVGFDDPLRMRDQYFVDDPREERLDPTTLRYTKGNTVSKTPASEIEEIVYQAAHALYAFAHKAQYPCRTLICDLFRDNPQAGRHGRERVPQVVAEHSNELFPFVRDSG